MVLLKIKVNGTTVQHQVASSWSEADRASLGNLLLLRAMGKGSKWWLDAAYILLPQQAQDVLCEANIIDIAPYFLWIWNDECLTYEALNGIVVAGKPLYIPSTGMYNVRGNEWVDGNGYIALHIKGRPNMVEHVIAVYCRPRNPNATSGDLRVPYNVEEATEIANWIVDNVIDSVGEIAKAVLWAYLLQETKRVTENPRYGKLFPKIEGTDADAPMPKPKVEAWHNFMLDAARLPNLGGDYEITTQKPIHLILSAVVNEIKINE